jgi:hypothetical protein
VLVRALKEQTDRLLNPQNQLINLPTNFSIPGYYPGMGGGSSTTVNESYNIQVPVTFNGQVTTPDIERTIRDTVARAIADGRQASSRAARKY